MSDQTMTFEAYCQDEDVAKDLCFMAAKQQVEDLVVSVFPGYGYHIEYTCPKSTQNSILVYVSNNERLYRMLNWL